MPRATFDPSGVTMKAPASLAAVRRVRMWPNAILCSLLAWDAFRLREERGRRTYWRGHRIEDPIPSVGKCVSLRGRSILRGMKIRMRMEKGVLGKTHLGNDFR